jgi:hypothetical protein
MHELSDNLNGVARPIHERLPPVKRLGQFLFLLFCGPSHGLGLPRSAAEPAQRLLHCEQPLCCFFFFFSFMHRRRAHSAQLFICQRLPAGGQGDHAGGHTISSGAGGAITRRSQACSAGTIGR